MTQRLLALTILLPVCGCAWERPPGPGDERLNPRDGALMVWVPGTSETCEGGKFRMGSSPKEIEALWRDNQWDPDLAKLAIADETPAHEMELDGFWVYKHEVTNDQYASFLQDTGHKPPQRWEEFRARNTLPVVLVTWQDAQDYAEWAGGSLPTAAQWEYAARGPESRPFPWGAQWVADRCNSAEYHARRALTEGERMEWRAHMTPRKPEEARGLRPGQTAILSQVGIAIPSDVAIAHLRPAESFLDSASWCGALNMCGNVWEWCRDWHQADFYRSPLAKERNPECTNSASGERELRGAGWYCGAWECRSAHRFGFGPAERDVDAGFRPVVSGKG